MLTKVALLLSLKISYAFFGAKESTTVSLKPEEPVSAPDDDDEPEDIDPMPISHPAGFACAEVPGTAPWAGNVETLAECKAKCGEFEQCRFATFWSSSKFCYLQKYCANTYEHKDGDVVQIYGRHDKFLPKLEAAMTADEMKTLRTFVDTLNFKRCENKQATDSMNTWLGKNFNENELQLWQNPMKSIWRDRAVEVPCNDEYWVDGSWHVQPMWAHCCNKAIGIAKCPEPTRETPSHCKKMPALKEECEDDALLLCPTYLQENKLDHQCLVYSFGIANAWEFEDWAGGDHGCEVHAFDPTTRFKNVHQQHNAKNVHFHYAGLRGGAEGTASKMTFSGYGSLGGQFDSLGGLWEMLGHKKAGRKIDLLKIDCEGCEWESFVYVAEKEKEVIENVCAIQMEIHVSESLQMETATQLKMMATFWRRYIKELGFRFWFIHTNPGADFDRVVNPLLAKIGLDPHTCCYEIGLYRPGCRSK